MKTTEYGKELLKAQRNTNLLLSALLAIQSSKMGNDKLNALSRELTERVSSDCEKINELLELDKSNNNT